MKIKNSTKKTLYFYVEGFDTVQLNPNEEEEFTEDIGTIYVRESEGNPR